MAEHYQLAGTVAIQKTRTVVKNTTMTFGRFVKNGYLCIMTSFLPN
jgi:hypothetical protein